MRWGEKRYNSLNYFLREKFGEKVYKVSLDGGFTCPNRDGTLSKKGCIFCSDSGSGEFAGSRKKSITDQIEEQLELIVKKFPHGNVIAYFQNFTNTYGDLEYLRKIYEEALSHPRVVGLAIATRPDCIDDKILDLLEELNNKTFLWIELGLQTTDEKTAENINRGWKLEVFDDIMSKLNNRDIKVVAHIILGLPNESFETMLASIRHIVREKVWGVKFHLLHIIKNTNLEKLYIETKFHTLTKEEYIELIAKGIGILDKDMVIHRLTGDGSRETLMEPKWSLDKRNVLNSIEKYLKENNVSQGDQDEKIT
ncbi:MULTISPECIES: TIGR01212 family radical SAM protein [Psychrilyobacter]|uniref:TIGR01212 family radical SAM protein n=1 Tax=Psychrilyobacter piezotolerans TaxID=2293438 RepID=A0ABX9KFN9_9FUSO|nr:MULTISPECIES: TIGR01212 family radical SAM protein [Psychrilyobacter]MCS5423190.1 TIGR01212 family radical SAM protein [Psychrilyobacter sp. S5]NDI78494.1 TIGR01212 family radical SAM protein [Psychrilyobacter piezotolerans]RDE60678.1 TIGR01212 family radical SAM protein [Psychrilyobacter sp. S5]REI40605.1 TIGR01212 family radical SAM protein [Psychrilyobacter piezotolerans]